jgi:hypothetical protein
LRALKVGGVEHRGTVPRTLSLEVQTTPATRARWRTTIVLQVNSKNAMVQPQQRPMRDHPRWMTSARIQTIISTVARVERSRAVKRITLIETKDYSLETLVEIHRNTRAVERGTAAVGINAMDPPTKIPHGPTVSVATVN